LVLPNQCVRAGGKSQKIAELKKALSGFGGCLSW
jgi:hypothetical protein